MNNVYVALLHYPVYNKKGDIVTTAVTNMDIHDISRAARTYGIRRFYIITPIEEQRRFAGKILHHWKKGFGASYNPSRKKAFEITEVSSSLEDVVTDIEKESETVHVVVTGASLRGEFITIEDLRVRMRDDTGAYLLLFGTGWGISDEIINGADLFIEPIRGPSPYNHLSVRSAVSIILDRLFGKR